MPEQLEQKSVDSDFPAAPAELNAAGYAPTPDADGKSLDMVDARITALAKGETRGEDWHNTVILEGLGEFTTGHALNRTESGTYTVWPNPAEQPVDGKLGGMIAATPLRVPGRQLHQKPE